jgi:hypothetical protein
MRGPEQTRRTNSVNVILGTGCNKRVPLRTALSIQDGALNWRRGRRATSPEPAMGFPTGDTVLRLRFPACLHKWPAELVGFIEEGILLWDWAKRVGPVDDSPGYSEGRELLL